MTSDLPIADLPVAFAGGFGLQVAPPEVETLRACESGRGGSEGIDVSEARVGGRVEQADKEASFPMRTECGMAVSFFNTSKAAITE
mmetsp:Transcript_41227/g.93007  ORF Transcript_41227/g.93007 Transcript_41227/m.93007 type:complete len:86 (+) Transcript_41227:346-603(+)